MAGRQKEPENRDEDQNICLCPIVPDSYLVRVLVLQYLPFFSRESDRDYMYFITKSCRMGLVKEVT